MLAYKKYGLKKLREKIIPAEFFCPNNGLTAFLKLYLVLSLKIGVDLV